MTKSSQHVCQYEILIDGILGLETLCEDPNLSLSHLPSPATGQPVTRLVLPVPDQARLRGFLNKLWDLNLTVFSVQRLF